MLVKVRRSLLVQRICNVIKSKLCIFLAVISMPSIVFIVKTKLTGVAGTNSNHMSKQHLVHKR
jgi:hypothetical protein